ncbi:MAG TPA: tRNA preQ1(34) S-adenosylmethionine ribosyltransferase-isomerase QueA [Mesotoga infera]|nr:tRNA preQ1(34) S-adenosylmethionine ribosyltransferase-isomerase QueA [Mesotoga infera]
MKTSEFDYYLPEELIAQKPVVPRDSSRLLVIDRARESIDHRSFREIIEYLNPGDTLVMNDSRVIPARLIGRKDTGASVEALLIEKIDQGLWKAIVRPGNKVKKGSRLIFGSLDCEVIEHCDDSSRLLDFKGARDDEINLVGRLAIPPYIHIYPEDPESYQTVYSKREGSIASPTAGLHFTPELLASISEKGVGIEYVTLHVGIGTFRPVKSERIEEHQMHEEYYTLSSETVEAVNRTKERSGKVVAVGTTTVRTLESVVSKYGKLVEDSGSTDIFIYPPYRFGVIDSLITNFHLPKSTLLMLVSAFAGRELIMEAYREAIEKRYRFFSFGDACLIL